MRPWPPRQGAAPSAGAPPGCRHHLRFQETCSQHGRLKTKDASPASDMQKGWVCSNRKFLVHVESLRYQRETALKARAVGRV